LNKKAIPPISIELFKYDLAIPEIFVVPINKYVDVPL